MENLGTLKPRLVPSLRLRTSMSPASRRFWSTTSASRPAQRSIFLGLSWRDVTGAMLRFGQKVLKLLESPLPNYASGQIKIQPQIHEPVLIHRKSIQCGSDLNGCMDPTSRASPHTEWIKTPSHQDSARHRGGALKNKGSTLFRRPSSS